MSTEIVLPSSLDNSFAGQLHGALAGADHSDVRIDGSAVERAGSQCLQVLLAAQKHWSAEGKHFDLVASAALSDILKTAGAHSLQTLCG